VSQRARLIDSVDNNGFDDLQLVELAARIKPVVVRNNLKKYVVGVDIKDSFNWADEDQMRVSANNLRPVCQIRTLHSTGYALFFKPSVEEVLQQAPSEILRDFSIVAFRSETLHRHVPYTFDSQKYMHMAMTTFFAGHLPEKIAKAPVMCNRHKSSPR
jgi:hypothetical protein